MALSDYLKFTAFYIVTTENEKALQKNITLDFGPCSEEDYKGFYEPAKQNKAAIEFAKQKNNMYCIKNPEVVDLYG